MPEDKPLTLDFAQRDAFKQIFPRSPILSSHEAGWEGIHFAHYRQPTHEVQDLRNCHMRSLNSCKNPNFR